MGITRDGLRLYVATVDQFGGDLVVIDTGANRVVDTIKIGSPIRGVALSPGGDTAYVASFEPGLGGVVDVVDTATNEVTATVEIGGSPTQLTLSSEGDRAYVVSNDHIAVLCTATNEVIDTITVGAQPSCVTESPDGKQLYVADYAGRVTVLSVASSTAPLLARVMALDVIAAPELLELLELEPATV
jgi:YVTN family beta-propeller protein